MEDTASKDVHQNLPETDSSVVGTPVLWDDTITMNLTGIKTLAYDMDPWYTEHKSVVWSSNYTDVATVDENGTVMAVGAGSAYEYTAEDGALHITSIVETPLTDMFREGTMPRITYHFSDIEFAGYTAEGDPMFFMSLYDYWNNCTTNELYLYVPGHDTGEWDDEAQEAIFTPARLFSLGNTGEHNIIASIHAAEITGGLDSEKLEVEGVKPLGIGLFSAK